LIEIIQLRLHLSLVAIGERDHRNLRYPNWQWYLIHITIKIKIIKNNYVIVEVNIFYKFLVCPVVGGVFANQMMWKSFALDVVRIQQGKTLRKA